eukprot:NODE_416_length_7838_cov_1.514537.p6 type:complete len:170 gc:universal NODE_416_length_7838_cov_1.514537:6744-6235(-)
MTQLKSNIGPLDHVFNQFIENDIVLVVGNSLSGKTSFCKLFSQQVEPSRLLWFSSVPQTSHIYVDCIVELLKYLNNCDNCTDIDVIIIDNLTHLLDAQPGISNQEAMNLLNIAIARFDNAICFCTSLWNYHARFASIIIKLFNTKESIVIKLLKSYRHLTPQEAVLTKG